MGADLQIKSAVQLDFPTQPAQSYQLEASSDLNAWHTWEPIILGDGSVLRRMAPVGQSPEFYRLKATQIVDLNPLLQPILSTNAVPALGCVVVRSNQIVAMGAVGVRKWNFPSTQVTVNDRWHHGSITKSMTATLAAMMVEKGEIRWDSTLAEVFPDFASSMHPQWREVTLELLLSNRSGAPNVLDPTTIWNGLVTFGGMPFEARRQLLEKLTVTPPNATPGTRYEYSNAGFSLAGHMLERVTGKPWEELLTERLFEPLGMTSAGFGPPSTLKLVDHPWGHQLPASTPVPAESVDNPTAIGPAATVHCSLADLARYAAFHIAGHRADTPLLSRASFVKLHTAYPDNSDYALGWMSVDRAWGKGEKVLTHSGSNNLWYTSLWFSPSREFAVIATCNIAGSPTNRGSNAANQTVTRMINEFLD